MINRFIFVLCATCFFNNALQAVPISEIELIQRQWSTNAAPLPRISEIPEDFLHSYPSETSASSIQEIILYKLDKAFTERDTERVTALCMLFVQSTGKFSKEGGLWLESLFNHPEYQETVQEVASYLHAISSTGKSYSHIEQHYRELKKNIFG